MSLIKTVRNLFTADKNKTPVQATPKAQDATIVATINDGQQEVTLSIPDDKTFREKGWIVGDWFNQQTLAEALSIQHGADASRQVLQKVAYEITRPRHPEDQKTWFRENMAEFVRLDPVYQDNIGKVREHIRQNPGVVQSELYKNQDEHHKQAVRYILYFAHELGDIRREKSGRSYKLYLTNDVID